METKRRPYVHLLYVFYLCLCSAALKNRADEDEGHCSKSGCPLHEVKFDHSNWKFHYVENNNIFLTAFLPEILKPSPRTPCIGEEENVKICSNWERYGDLHIKYTESHGVACHNVLWTPSSQDFKPMDCLSLLDANWYGGSELHTQKWPLQNVDIPMQPFVSQDAYIMKKSYGNVLEPFWINSNGVGVVVNDNVPLHVSTNENGSMQLCLKAEFSDPHFKPQIEQVLPSLNYTICKGKNLKSIHQFMYKNYFHTPTEFPDLRMMKSPIWSTWARYKTLIDQSKVLQYADEILEHNFSNSQLEIDDMFSTRYGEFNFETKKFQNAGQMIQTLKSKGFRVTAWVTPFANLDSESFKEGTEKGYWLKDIQEHVPSLVHWWQGIGAIIDVTNPDAVKWYVSRLEKMRQDYGVDSFKFDAGEMTYMPSSYKTFKRLENPGMFTKLYVDTVNKLGNMIEVRCGYKSQQYPVLVRMADKDSKWGYDNGLRTIIPVALTMGILGYPFIIPDMIGGNGYGEVMGRDAILPDRELYIRWLQLSAYMPSMQFSFVPWQYDQEVVDIAKQMINVHETLVTPIIVKAAAETMDTGAPLIRPLWWIAPDDAYAQTIDSEFMIGNEILVAPILDKGVTSRDVYLPVGKWINDLTGTEIEGSKWIRNVKADLHQIPTFTAVQQQNTEV